MKEIVDFLVTFSIRNKQTPPILVRKEDRGKNAKEIKHEGNMALARISPVQQYQPNHNDLFPQAGGKEAGTWGAAGV